jgi:glucan biosynthesis protein
MPWYVIRKDFTNADTVACAFGCGRPITSGVAFVVQDVNGNTGFAGSRCVMRATNYQTDTGTIPNFTSATYLQNVNAGGNAGGSAGGPACNYILAVKVRTFKSLQDIDVGKSKCGYADKYI